MSQTLTTHGSPIKWLHAHGTQINEAEFRAFTNFHGPSLPVVLSFVSLTPTAILIDDVTAQGIGFDSFFGEHRFFLVSRKYLIESGGIHSDNLPIQLS